MNEYIIQTLAFQRMDETARRVRAAHHVSAPEQSSRLPRLRRHVVRRPRLALI